MKDTFLNKVIVKTAQLMIPNIGIVGWDVALDSNDNPLLIEVNIGGPGILYEQLCTGPIFGERTQEVIEYCKKLFCSKEDRVQKFVFLNY